MPKVKCFRCTHSGLLLPPDYAANWGKLYGMGLGSRPVSEVMDTVYSAKPTAKRQDHRCSDDELMLPFCYSCAPIEMVEVEQAVYDKKENRAILNIDDPGRERRMKILREKQKTHEEWKYVKQLQLPGFVGEEKREVWA